MFCIKCGSKNPDDGSFCQKCGIPTWIDTGPAPLTALLEAGLARIPNEAKPGILPVNAKVNERLVGVKGWLLLLCISLTTLIPLFNLYYLNRLWVEFLPYFPTSPEHKKLFKIVATYGFCMPAYGIYAGFLLSVKGPYAVQTTKLFLAGSLLLVAISYPLLRSIVPFPPEVWNAAAFEFVKEFFKQLVFSSIWFTYLSKSKRVRATYEKEIDSNLNELIGPFFAVLIGTGFLAAIILSNVAPWI